MTHDEKRDQSKMLEAQTQKQEFAGKNTNKIFWRKIAIIKATIRREITSSTKSQGLIHFFGSE